MRIRTEIPSVGSGKFLQSMLSYVQINIYNTNLKALRKEGVNLRDLLENVGHRSVIMDVPFLSSETGRMSSIAAKRVIKSNSGSIRQKRSLGVRRASRSFCVRRRHASCSTAEDGLVANKKASSFCIMDLSKRDEMETSVAPQDCVLTKETSGPLTSTPLPEKRPITFENFSKENGFGEAQHSNEPGVDNGEDVPLSCLEVRLCGSNSRDPPIAADAGCDGDSQLFQDCIDESDRTLDVHSCAADPPENLEFAAAVKAASGVGRQITDVNVISHPIGAPFGGSESTSCMPMPPNNVFAEPDAMAEQLSNDQCVAELPAGIVKQEEPSSGDDTITASRSFVSFSQQVMQGLMSVNNDYVTIPHRSLYHSDTAEYLCPTLRSLEHTGGVSTSSKLMLGEPNPTYCSIEIAQTEHMQHEEDPARNYGKVQSNVPEREVDALINTGNALEPSTHEHELWPSASVNRPVKLSPISSKSKSISTSCNSTPHIKGQMTCSAPKRSSPPELTVAADASAMDRNESPPECTSTPKRTRRKRLRASSSDQDNCGAEKNEGLEAVQNECGNEVLVGTEKNMLFRCHMEGCGREILWRPRYGKHRLVEHARTHWTNAVKICKICGFKAPRIRRVYKHHQIAHKGEPYHGAISAETEADMVELLQLWKKCFPAQLHTMKGRTLPAVRGSSSYVQINVYDTNLRELRERGVDIKHMLQHIGCRSVVMDVPILSPQSQNVPLCRRFKTFGVFDARSASIRNDCVSNCDNIIRRRRANSVVIKREEGNSEELFVDQCDYELGVAKESGVTASGTTVMDFSVSHVGEGNRGPLTSTPMFEKTFNHFEAFISQNIVDESPSRKSIHQTSHEGNLSNRPQKNFPCTHGETTHTEQETLFQDCLEDADSSMEYAERFEHLTLSLKTDCDSSPGKGNPVGSHLTVGAPPCTSNSLELECIPSRDPAVGSVLKKEEMDEPEACDRTMVADVSFRSFSCEVVQSLQSLNSVTETDLNKTMACHDCDERNSGDVHLCGNDGEVALNVDKAPSSATLGQPTSEEDNSYHLYEAKSMAVKKNNESSKVFSNSESSSSIQRTQGNVKHYEITSGGLERYIHENSAAEAKILKDFRSQDVEDSPKPHERSSRSRRKRARSQDSEEVDEATEAVKQESGQNHRENPSTVNDVIKVFHCHMKGCGRDLTWRPRYGKNRLVEHVRTHWPNLVKCCKICDFKASSVKKVIYHHKCTHRDVPYTGAKSLETKKDMEQLVDLWKECFPDARARLSRR